MKVRIRERAYIASVVCISALDRAGIEYEIAVAPACQPRLDNTESERAATMVPILTADSRAGTETDNRGGPSHCRASGRDTGV